MAIVQEKNQADVFTQQELVTWHYSNGTERFPLAGVVIRQEFDSVVIKTRIHGAFQEVHVNPEQLVKR